MATSKQIKETANAIGGLVILAGIIFVVGKFLFAIGGALSGGGEAPLCVQRGVAYFREIGSYPKLSDGRDAETVAYERCGRSLDAF